MKNQTFGDGLAVSYHATPFLYPLEPPVQRVPHLLALHVPISVSAALKNYADCRSNGEKVDDPSYPFPYDGNLIVIDSEPNSEWANFRYDEGPRDKLWMAEKDKNYLQSTHASPSSLKKQTFGVSTGKNMWIPGWQAIEDYQIKRGNGTSADYPPRLFPIDGKYSWTNPNAQESTVRYDEGSGDKEWMEERDRNYVFRLERERRLDQTEPNLKTERPKLFAEIAAARISRFIAGDIRNEDEWRLANGSCVPNVYDSFPLNTFAKLANIHFFAEFEQYKNTKQLPSCFSVVVMQDLVRANNEVDQATEAVKLTNFKLAQAQSDLLKPPFYQAAETAIKQFAQEVNKLTFPDRTKKESKEILLTAWAQSTELNYGNLVVTCRKVLETLQVCYPANKRNPNTDALLTILNKIDRREVITSEERAKVRTSLQELPQVLGKKQREANEAKTRLTSLQQDIIERTRQEVEAVKKSLAQEKAEKQCKAQFTGLLQQITNNTIPTLDLSGLTLRANSSEISQANTLARALTNVEILQALQALKNNHSVIELKLQALELDSTTCIELCEIIKNKVLAKIDLTDIKIPEAMHDILQEALLTPKSRAMQIIGFTLPPPKESTSSQQVLPSPLPMPIPIVASGYQICYQDLEYGAELGRGSFGIVRRGRWQHTEVAIKELIMQQMDPQVLQNFEQEIGVMASLHHPNVIHLCGACMDPGHYSLVMEYMPKDSLYKVLHNSSEALPWPQRWQIAYDVARGVLHLHQHNPEILHRDLKSLNVLLDANYTAKVSDFGLSKAKTETRSTTKTGAGNTGGGTLLWSAPELFGLKPKPSKASDVYAFAIILWEIAARTVPYEGVELEEVKSCVKQGERMDIPEGTPKAFAALIADCWAQSPEKRPAIEKVIADIEKNMPQGSSTTTVAPKPTLSAQIRKVEGLIEEGVALQCSMMRNIEQKVSFSGGSSSQVGPALAKVGVFGGGSSSTNSVTMEIASNNSTTTPPVPKST